MPDIGWQIEQVARGQCPSCDHSKLKGGCPLLAMLKHYNKGIWADCCHQEEGFEEGSGAVLWAFNKVPNPDKDQAKKKPWRERLLVCRMATQGPLHQLSLLWSDINNEFAPDHVRADAKRQVDAILSGRA